MPTNWEEKYKDIKNKYNSLFKLYQDCKSRYSFSLQELTSMRRELYSLESECNQLAQAEEWRYRNTRQQRTEQQQALGELQRQVKTLQQQVQTKESLVNKSSQVPSYDTRSDGYGRLYSDEMDSWPQNWEVEEYKKWQFLRSGEPSQNNFERISPWRKFNYMKDRKDPYPTGTIQEEPQHYGDLPPKVRSRTTWLPRLPDNKMSPYENPTFSSKETHLYGYRPFLGPFYIYYLDK